MGMEATRRQQATVSVCFSLSEGGEKLQCSCHTEVGQGGPAAAASLRFRSGTHLFSGVRADDPPAPSCRSVICSLNVNTHICVT